MQSFDTLEGIVGFMLQRHPSVRRPDGGCTAWKFLRRPDGSRVAIEEQKGFKIVQYNLMDENGLSITQLASGYTFDSRQKHVMSSQLFLHDLVLVNVYDFKTEFFSSASIDFVYILNEWGVRTQVAQALVNEDAGIIRGQWIKKDQVLESLLEQISFGKQVEVAPQVKRGIHVG